MAGFALNDASERDYGVDVGVLGEKLSAQGQLKSAWDILYKDVVFGATGLSESCDGATEQRFGHFAVPFGHHDPEPHIVRGRDRSEFR